MEGGRRGRRTHNSLNHPPIIPIAEERVLVLLPIHGDAAPPELRDADVRLVDVRVLGREERPDVQRELLRGEDVRRGLGED